MFTSCTAATAPKLAAVTFSILIWRFHLVYNTWQVLLAIHHVEVTNLNWKSAIDSVTATTAANALTLWRPGINSRSFSCGNLSKCLSPSVGRYWIEEFLSLSLPISPVRYKSIRSDITRTHAMMNFMHIHSSRTDCCGGGKNHRILTPIE